MTTILTKLLMLLALLLSFFMNGNAQLLYKISGNGLTKSSYIIGTYHLAPVSFVDSIPGLKEALDASEQVYGELDMTDLTSPENIQKVQASMMLPEGTTISSLLTAEEMERLNAVLKELMGMDMTNPLVKQQLDGLTPMVLQTQLTLLIYMKKHAGFNPQAPFDGYFQQVAQQQGKAVGGLETLDFQMKILYNGQPLERQKELLMCLVDDKEHMELMAEQLVKAFFAQDLEGMKAVMDEKQQTRCDSSPEEEYQIIYNRNANWAVLMPDIMAAKPTLFAVGAGHLPGEKGVLKLLQNAGFIIEEVK